MAILNYTSVVPVTQTVGEIQAVLNRRGVSRISTVFDDESNAVGLAFTLATDYGVRDFELPIRIEGVLAALQSDTSIPKGKRTPEQAARTAWRIALSWLETQAALVDAELAKLDEVMMPFMVDGRGRTMYSLMRSSALGELER